MKYPYLIGRKSKSSNLEFAGLLYIVLLILYIPNLLIFSLYLNEHTVSVGFFVLENIIYISLIFYIFISTYKMGIYLDEQGLYKKGVFLKRRVRPQSVKGIKVTKSIICKYKKGILNVEYLVPEADENGEYVYCMFFLKKIYDDMSKFNEGSIAFQTEYRECIIGVTNYDLPAINRLRELIPDLVVMYEE